MDTAERIDTLHADSKRRNALRTISALESARDLVEMLEKIVEMQAAGNYANPNKYERCLKQAALCTRNLQEAGFEAAALQVLDWAQPPTPLPVTDEPGPVEEIRRANP